ncbi:MAG TPA: enoyl-CoA hydratase/isomerase family protein [Burkholderiaceae bacterium]|nr:enoyl-CoA hydratase/isomerase family protein [Burkholderiaceae bacterium]
MATQAEAGSKQSTGGTVKSERRGNVTILSLCYPERRNALSMPLRAVFAEQLQAAMDDPECRAIVLTGEGAHFCSGGDISGFGDVTPPAGRSRMQSIHRVVRMLVRGEKPVIAAVEGHAAGAGLCIAACCDIVVASRDAKFSCTFNKVGLLPDLGGLWAVPLRMGLGRSKMLMMSGRVLDGETASRQGLVDEVCEPGKALETALELAGEIAANAPLSHGLIKSALARGPMPLEDLLALEVDAQAVLFGSEDFKEGTTAFLEKRKPAFRGR